ncbi:MAG: metallophosphoesterase [Oscillospiraceae bacterium]|nr:metallophosphoesterase [Oscillospiraceae bacterium]
MREAMMRDETHITLLCDLHLPLLKKTPAYDVFDRAVKWLEQSQPDYIFTLGDITAHGNLNAAEHFVKKMDGTGLPWAAVPGNAELRDPETAEQILTMLESPLREKPLVSGDLGWKLLLLDCSAGSYPEKEREKLIKTVHELNAGEHLILLQHQGPGDLDEESRAFLKELLSPVAESCLIIYGHKHRFGADTWEGIPAFRLQALDPDKAIGTPPKFLTLILDPDGKWDIILSEPYCFDKETVRDITGRLGLSCFHLPKDLDYAIEHGVRAIELRHGNMQDLPEEELLRKIAAWRTAGGKYLSLHATEPGWKDGSFTRAEGWLDSAGWAKKIGADAITLHVPKAPVCRMKPRSAIRRKMKKLYLEGFGLLPEDCDIHIENMHMNPGEIPDENRRFGYLPGEVKSWIRELRKEYHTPEKITFLLDVGHARNNAPYSSVYTMGMWYAMMGSETDACHMHQVVNSPEGMKNHQAITDLFGPLINFSGFAAAWEKGQIRPRTIFLEVRSLENYLTSLETWKKACE